MTRCQEPTHFAHYAASTGLSFSSWVGGPLTKRYPMRTVSLAFVAIGLVAQLVCFVSIQSNWFAWYVIGKFLTSFGYGYVITVLYELASCSRENNDAAYAGIEEAGRSSSIVAGIVGGLLALLGSVWIYVVSAALGAVLLWGLWKTLPNNLGLDRISNQKEAESESSGTVAGQVSSVHRFLRSPQMILISIFGFIPLAVAGGYKSYFLPLFLSSSSYTNTQISNYSVICNLALYEATKGLRSFRLKSDSWLLTWASFAAIAVLFGMFARNQSAVWAVLAAILISILCWLAKRCRSLARTFGMFQYNLDYEEAYGAVSWMDSFVGNIRSVAMGAFLSLGTTNGCLALAACMLASSLLFAIALRPYYQKLREDYEANLAAA